MTYSNIGNNKILVFAETIINKGANICKLIKRMDAKSY